MGTDSSKVRYFFFILFPAYLSAFGMIWLISLIANSDPRYLREFFSLIPQIFSDVNIRSMQSASFFSLNPLTYVRDVH